MDDRVGANLIDQSRLSPRRRGCPARRAGSEGFAGRATGCDSLTGPGVERVEIVDHDHLGPIGQEPIDQVRTDESRPAGHDDSHGTWASGIKKIDQKLAWRASGSDPARGPRTDFRSPVTTGRDIRSSNKQSGVGEYHKTSEACQFAWVALNDQRLCSTIPSTMVRYTIRKYIAILRSRDACIGAGRRPTLLST